MHDATTTTTTRWGHEQGQTAGQRRIQRLDDAGMLGWDAEMLPMLCLLGPGRRVAPGS